MRKAYRSASGWAHLCGLGFAGVPASSSAHIELIEPPPRYEKDLQKHGPCGDPNNGPGSGMMTRYESGETIRIKFDEFVDHRSHFRISLSIDGDQDFVDPKGFDDLDVSQSVLLDGIKDTGQGLRSIEVTLPNIECRRCTLQLMQVMYEGEFDPDRSFYYQCADIVIGVDIDHDSTNPGSGGTDDSEEGGPVDPEVGNDSSHGCRMSPRIAGSLTFSWLILLTSTGLRQRRRK